MFAARKTDNVSSAANYIEECFSTYLYTGNGSTQTITNGIDLSGKGGLVWCKSRGSAVDGSHFLNDTVRGVQNYLRTNGTSAQQNRTDIGGLTAFNSNGFSLVYNTTGQIINENNITYASWTFRKQAKFFDVVTYTGNGTYPRNISHNLGSTPGCIIVKKLSATSDWFVYHRSLSVDGTFGPYRILLNTTAAQSVNDDWKNAPTSTQFTVNNSDTNGNGVTYVAYLFAHDAGGFGATGSDNVISCGSYTGNGSATGPTVTLGYEPQWVLVKRTDSTSNWTLSDNMRGQPVDGATAILNPNLSDAEASATTAVSPTATGFQVKTSGATYNASGGTYIYIAIRRGPMKTPTSGTSVFTSITRAGTGANATVSGIGFNPDLVMSKATVSGWNWNQFDRLRGRYKPLFSSREWPEDNQTTSLTGFDVQNGYTLGADSEYQEINYSGYNYYNYHFGRAPNYFDIVAYSGSGSNATQSHNLSSVPELMFVKRRNGTPLTNVSDWQVYSSALLNTEYLVLNSTNAKATGTTRWNSTTPTSTVFSVGTDATVNGSGNTYVAYLFATVAGVSKVGSYTGTGTTLQVDCGFTAGARFVMIKRTDSTGDWYVWDSAQGIVAGNDPYLRINSSGAQVTNTDYVDAYSAGFEISSTAPAAINANGGTFIFLAIS